jgi:hypothetical protein
MIMNTLKKIIKEPLLLFVLFGTLMYIIYSQSADYIDKKNKQIFISSAQIGLLEEAFRKTWNRNPTQDETKAQIQNLVMDEVFFKEAVAMGLDKTDPAIKRRLRQVLELMLDDYATIYPTENQLRDYLNAHPDKFQRDPLISFRHLYYPIEDKEEALNLLLRLKQGKPFDENAIVGLLLVPNQFENERKLEVGKLFGNIFTQKLFELEPGNWQGPLESAYGWHLVKISEKVVPGLPELNEIWDLVEREWSVESKKEMKEMQYQAMREQYEIIVEQQEDKNQALKNNQ